MSVYCTRCGHGNPDGANFCARCGTPLSGLEDSTVTLHGVGSAESEVVPEDDELAVSLDELSKDQGLLVVKRGPNAGSKFLLDKDLTNKQIARELVLAPGTVKVHTTNLYRKLSVDNRRAAVTLAKALGLLAAD